MILSTFPFFLLLFLLLTQKWFRVRGSSWAGGKEESPRCWAGPCFVKYKFITLYSNLWTISVRSIRLGCNISFGLPKLVWQHCLLTSSPSHMSVLRPSSTMYLPTTRGAEFLQSETVKMLFLWFEFIMCICLFLLLLTFYSPVINISEIRLPSLAGYHEK